MSFKIPIYNPIFSWDALNNWFQSLFGRYSGSDLIKFVIIPIGNWQMKDNPIFRISLKIPKKILNLSILIYDDLEVPFIENITHGIKNISIKPKEIVITRKKGGVYDQDNFNNKKQRGKIILWLST